MRTARFFSFSRLFAAITASFLAFSGAAVADDATLTDNASGLTWKRCAEGQTWQGSDCTGKAQGYPHIRAVKLDKGGWRLPTITELAALADLDKRQSIIDKAAFPNTPADHFWSATGYAGQHGHWWAVNFKNGAVYPSRGEKYFYVRLVRGEPQSNAANRAGQAFSDAGDGKVVHEPTGLAWKRCAEGQSQAGTRCIGTAGNYTWDDAQSLAVDGWRLPTRNELLGIVAWENIGPAIDAAIFPGTPAAFFWSANSAAGTETNAWSVGFQDGYSDVSGKSARRHVRLVRDAGIGGMAAADPATARADGERLFNWAESLYAAYFFPAKPPLLESQGFVYRYYSGTGLYLAVKDGKLWIAGPFNPNQLADAGAYLPWLKRAKAAGF